MKKTSILIAILMCFVALYCSNQTTVLETKKSLNGSITLSNDTIKSALIYKSSVIDSSTIAIHSKDIALSTKNQPEIIYANDESLWVTSKFVLLNDTVGLLMATVNCGQLQPGLHIAKIVLKPSNVNDTTIKIPVILNVRHFLLKAELSPLSAHSDRVDAVTQASNQISSLKVTVGAPLDSNDNIKEVIIHFGDGSADVQYDTLNPFQVGSTDTLPHWYSRITTSSASVCTTTVRAISELGKLADTSIIVRVMEKGKY